MIAAWLARMPALLAVLAGLIVAGWAGTLLVSRTNGLAAPPNDLAFFEQVIWNVGTRGLWISSFHQGSFLGLHFSPILVVPAVIERVLGPDVRILDLIHAATVGALVPATYLFLGALLRPSRWGPPIAAALAIGLPLGGTMQDVIRSDFHPETVGLVLALVAGWAGLSGRRRTMWVLALLALATREDVSYGVAIVGIVVAVRGRGASRRSGRRLAFIAIAWTILVFGVIMPTIRNGVTTETDAYYAWLGGGIGAFLAPFNRTAAVLAHVLRPTPWLAVAGMVAGLAGLALLRPRWTILAGPPLLAVLLSDHTLQGNLRLQYGLILVMPLLVSAGFGARRALAIATRLGRGFGRRRHVAGRARRSGARSRLPSIALGAALLVPATVGAWVQGSVPPFDWIDPDFAARPSRVDALERVTAVVPADAVLAVDEGLAAPLAGRAQIRRLVAGPTAPLDAYVVMDRHAWSVSQGVANRHGQILAALLGSDRPVLADDGELIVWGPAQ